jgi:hypothetical protein
MAEIRSAVFYINIYPIPNATGTAYVHYAHFLVALCLLYVGE